MNFYSNNNAIHFKQVSLTRINIFIICFVTCFWFIYTWFYSDASWLHPELLGTAAYIQNNPDETFFQTLRKIFDWQAFDPNVNRVRPLNDIVEVIDAMARPNLAKIFGPHPSAMPSALITAFFAPIYLFLWLRSTVRRPVLAILLCAVFISSIAFLSVIVGYIRPAKKLNILFLCMSLYYADQFKNSGTKKDFAMLYLTLLGSFFSDEAGLANFVIIGLFYWQDLFKSSNKYISYWYLGLPLVFLVLTKLALPSVYSHWSLHGKWDALSDASKVKIFKYLLEPKFYIVAGKELARSFLSMLSISKHMAMYEIALLGLFVGLPAVHIIQHRLFTFSKLVQNKFVLITIITAATSIYLTLLDWYPFPFEVSYLGSFNYYYHSAMAIPCIMWLALCVDTFSLKILKFTLLNSVFANIIFCFATVFFISSNFLLFKDVNQLVQIIHIYPYNNAELWSVLNKSMVFNDKIGNEFQFKVVSDAGRESNQYRSSLIKVFGKEWNRNGFFDVMTMISPTPIMSDQHIRHLFKSTLPNRKFEVVFTKVEGEGWHV